MTIDEFTTNGYQKHNQARQDHLAGLGLDLCDKTVLELGAGIGDHTQFWVNRLCDVNCVDGRPENMDRLRKRFPRDQFPNVRTVVHDLNSVYWPFSEYDIVYAYGILYHLTDPVGALHRWAYSCRNLLLLETVVSRDGHERIKVEDGNPTAALTDHCVWPTRSSILFTLRELFPHVYVPITPPNHIEFPTDWCDLPSEGLVRMVVIASKQGIDNDQLGKIKL